jgi:hypothetical protein
VAALRALPGVGMCDSQPARRRNDVKGDGGVPRGMNKKTINEHVYKKTAAQKYWTTVFPFQSCKIALFSKDTGFAEETFFQSNLFIVV